MGCGCWGQGRKGLWTAKWTSGAMGEGMPCCCAHKGDGGGGGDGAHGVFWGSVVDLTFHFIFKTEEKFFVY